MCFRIAASIERRSGVNHNERLVQLDLLYQKVMTAPLLITTMTISPHAMCLGGILVWSPQKTGPARLGRALYQIHCTNSARIEANLLPANPGVIEQCPPRFPEPSRRCTKIIVAEVLKYL